MDLIAKKQIEINLKKETILKSYPNLWNKMLSEWSTPEGNDRGWMLYSANYLFQTAGVRWEMDPLRLAQRVPNAPDMDVSPLAMLDYIILTHQHADHLDLGLLQLLQYCPAIWIVPETLLDQLRSEDLQPKKIMIPSSLEQASPSLHSKDFIGRSTILMRMTNVGHPPQVTWLNSMVSVDCFQDTHEVMLRMH